jgi:hypothetical protein
MGGFISAKKSPIAKMQMVASVQGMKAAFDFAKLGPRTVQKGTLEAIELARQNIGAYKPEITESRRLTDLGALGITDEQIDKYTNPYLQDVLDYSIKEMEDAAQRRRMERRAIASRSGNDFATSGATNRYQIEDDLADRTMFREIGGITAQQRAEAYKQAAGLATDERERQHRAGVTYADYANQTQELGLKDAGTLEHVGELEGLGEQYEREHLLQMIDAYGASAANAQSSVNQYQKGSVLSQIVGAVGGIASILAPGASSLHASPDSGAGAQPPSFSSLSGENTPGSIDTGSGTYSGAFSGGGALGGFGGADPVSGSGSATAIPSGGLASLGTTLGSLFGGGGGSDPRFKFNIRRIGTLAKDIGFYVWTYVWGETSTGVMSDEVAKVMPEAVSRFMGYDFVDYSMIGGRNA